MRSDLLSQIVVLDIFHCDIDSVRIVKPAQKINAMASVLNICQFPACIKPLRTYILRYNQGVGFL